MHKLKLDLQDLAVTSFETQDGSFAAGTVRARETGWDDTCVNTCPISCGGTCAGITCNGAGTCAESCGCTADPNTDYATCVETCATCFTVCNTCFHC